MKHEKLTGSWNDLVLRSLAEGDPARAAKIDRLLFDITTAGAELDALVDEQEALLARETRDPNPVASSERGKPLLLKTSWIEDSPTPKSQQTFVGPFPAVPSLLRPTTDGASVAEALASLAGAKPVPTAQAAPVPPAQKPADAASGAVRREPESRPAPAVAINISSSTATDKRIDRAPATKAGEVFEQAIAPAAAVAAERQTQPLPINAAPPPKRPEVAVPSPTAKSQAASEGDATPLPKPPASTSAANVTVGEILPPAGAPADRPALHQAPKADEPAQAKPQARSAPPIIEADGGPLKSPTARTATEQVADKASTAKKPAAVEKTFHKRTATPTFNESLQNGIRVVRINLAIVMGFTAFINVLVLAIPIYLFQISDRVLTSRSLDTLVMLTAVIVGAVIMQVVLDAVRRFILMRTAVEVAVQLGTPILSAAARASLHGNGRDYQVLGDLQQVRAFITSGTLLAFFDAPMAPLFVLAVFLIHPELGYIVVASALCLLVVAIINQRLTAKPFADANGYLSRATLHLDSMSRNSQIINALAMIPEAVRIWGRDTAASLTAHVEAQDRNIIMASVSKGIRLLTQVCMLGWGATLAIEGHITGGMVIAGSIVASRALSPIEGAIEGWNGFTQFRTSFARIRNLLQSSPFNFERLILPDPKGRVDVERLLFVPPPNKKVLLNGISFSLLPGESLAVIGNSGAGKTTLGKMLVGSIVPTSGSVRLDLMDLRNWDQRQFGESIGYLPQDVQLFPGTIKANIARMREDVTDQSIFDAAVLADVHELIASFPQGYETYVAGDGAPLSGGQKQRIALARAFFGSPKMVVLDEPNSNLDSPGEAALAKALMHAKREQITVITITQRPALLNVVDKILVLNNGSVSMFGTRSEVMTALARNKTTPGEVGLAAPTPTAGA